MDTYQHTTGDKVRVEGGHFDIKELIRLARENEIVAWSLVYKVPAEQVTRRAVIFSNEGKRVVTWVEYRDIIRNRDSDSFIYDGIRNRFYSPGNLSKSSLGFHVICDVLKYLAQCQYCRKAHEIAAHLNLGQEDETAAIRQAVKRIRTLAPDLINTEDVGYQLNPDYQWLIIRETGA